MKTVIAKISLALAVLALSFQALLPATQAQQIKTNPPFEFDKAAYEKRVRQAFDGQVMGYATVLIKNGLVVSEVAGGWARNAADGGVKMTTSIPANIGSTIKFTGGVTLLHLFESKSKVINPTGRSVNEWLSLPIYTYFPKIWQDGMDASIKKITFRHLLQHRSGFPKNVSGDDLGDDGQKRMFDYLAAGVTNGNFNQRLYANANVSLITYLIPMIANPALRDAVNQEAAQKKWKAEEAPIHKRIADEWEKYIHGQIYSQITPAIKPSCNPTVEFAKQNRVWAPDYKSASDAGKGSTRDSRVSNTYCQAQGGWYISARDLAAFVANFNATNTLVSQQTRDLMFDDDNQNERLVWSFPISDPLIQQKFNLKVLPYMGGDHGGAHATILMLPNGYYAVGVINSDDMNSGGVTKGLLEAFKSGIGFGVKENPKCATLRGNIKSLEAEIADWQKDLQEAGPSQKGAIGNQIKTAKIKLGALKAEAIHLGCEATA